MLDVKQVLDVALKIEQNGSEFYDLLTASATDSEAAALFGYMARQERDHIEFVQALAEKLGELPAPEAATEPHQGYVEALMEAHILVQEGAGAALAKRAADLAGATKGAVQFEKDTILLFQTLANLVPEAGMTAVETLIGQEKMHLLDLYQFSTLLKMAERNQPTQDAGGSHKPQKGKMR